MAKQITTTAYEDELMRSEDFYTQGFIREKCRNSNAPEIGRMISNFNQRIRKENADLVSTLEKDSNLFVSLSQCIALYEREFESFPQKISEVQGLVQDAKLFPKLQLSEIPPSPKVKDYEILGRPPFVVDAPILYESLVQQHKINESIDLVISTKNKLDDLASEPNYIPLVEIEDWVKRISQTIYLDTLNRIKLTPSNSDQLLGEFRRLLKLGFEQEGLDIYLKYATKAVDEKLHSVQNNGQLLNFTREYTETLTSEIQQRVTTFLRIFKSHRFTPRIISWANEIIETRIPLVHPEWFVGNYNLVKDSIIIMRNFLSKLEDIGISTFQIFDSLSTYLKEFLVIASARHISDISESINRDDWDVSTEGIKEMKPEYYPFSPSLEKFNVHLIQFLQEMRDIYLPTMFYDASNLLKQVILSYTNCLIILFRRKLPDFEDFCVIITQIVCIEQVIFPDILDSFAQITNYYFPNETIVLTEIRKTLTLFEDALVKGIVTCWAAKLPARKIQWKGITNVDPHFIEAARIMAQYIQLEIPKDQFSNMHDMFIHNILIVAHNIGTHIYSDKMLNSFTFQWEYVSRSLMPYLTKKASEALEKGIQKISEAIAETNNISDHNRESPEKISLAVTKFMKANPI